MKSCIAVYGLRIGHLLTALLLLLFSSKIHSSSVKLLDSSGEKHLPRYETGNVLDILAKFRNIPASTWLFNFESVEHLNLYQDLLRKAEVWSNIIPHMLMCSGTAEKAPSSLKTKYDHYSPNKLLVLFIYASADLRTTQIHHDIKYMTDNQSSNPSEDFYVVILAASLTQPPGVPFEIVSSITSIVNHVVLMITSQANSSRILSLCPYCDSGRPGAVRVDWPKHDENLTLTLFPSFNGNLNGKNIKASCLTTINRVKLRKVNGEYKLFKTGGLFPRAFITIAEKINASYTLLGESLLTMVFPNGSFHGGLIGTVKDGKADIGMAGLMSLDVYERVDLSVMVDYGYLTFYIGPKQPVYTWTSIVRPLSWLVWIGLLLSTVIALVFLYATRRAVENLQHENLARFWTVKRFVRILVGSFILQPVDTPSQDPLRLFLVLWSAFALVVTTAYQTKLYGFFVFPPYETSPSTFDQLGDSDYAIGFTNFGGSTSGYFRASKSGSGTQRIFYRMSSVNTSECYWQARISSKYACITFNGEMESYTQIHFGRSAADSGLTTTSEGALSAYAGFIFPQHSLLTSLVNRIARPMFDGGLGLYWTYSTNIDLREEVRELEGTKNRTKASGSVLRLNIQHIQGAVTVTFASYLISCFTFMYELGFGTLTAYIHKLFAMRWLSLLS